MCNTAVIDDREIYDTVWAVTDDHMHDDEICDTIPANKRYKTTVTYGETCDAAPLDGDTTKAYTDIRTTPSLNKAKKYNTPNSNHTSRIPIMNLK